MLGKLHLICMKTKAKIRCNLSKLIFAFPPENICVSVK